MDGGLLVVLAHPAGIPEPPGMDAPGSVHGDLVDQTSRLVTGAYRNGDSHAHSHRSSGVHDSKKSTTLEQTVTVAEHRGSLGRMGGHDV